MRQIAKSLVELVGNTPLLELGKFSAAHGIATPIVAKVEYFDPEENFEYKNFDYANL